MKPVMIEVTVESATHMSSVLPMMKMVLAVDAIESVMPDPNSDGDGCILVTKSSIPVLGETDFPIAAENREYYVRESIEDITEILEKHVTILRPTRKPTFLE